MYCIFHKVAGVLYGKYSTVMQIIVVVIGVKFQRVSIVTTDLKLNPLLICKNEFFLHFTQCSYHLILVCRKLASTTANLGITYVANCVVKLSATRYPT